jgi:hypothetical protein
VDSPAFAKQLLEALAAFEPVLSTEGGAYRVCAKNQAKSAVVVWPYPLAEVFLDFMEDSEVVLSESVEYYAEEPPAEQVKDIAQVLRNFFLNETRVATVGAALKRRELQFRHGNQWVSVLSGASET